VSDRYRILAAFVRKLLDDDLNDLQVELPRGRFAALVDASVATNQAGEIRLRRLPPTCRNSPGVVRRHERLQRRSPALDAVAECLYPTRLPWPVSAAARGYAGLLLIST
jgi:hypothetical protein